MKGERGSRLSSGLKAAHLKRRTFIAARNELRRTCEHEGVIWSRGRERIGKGNANLVVAIFLALALVLC